VTIAPPILAIFILLAGLLLIGLLAWLVYRFFGWIGFAVACAGGILLITLWGLSDSPKARVAAVRAALEKIPDVTITNISDLEKQASESITARLKISGKGELGFVLLEPQSFKDSRHICINGIGPFGSCSRTKVGG
jgi:hypothetical protein